MATIKKIHARQILDSRGNPTVEAEVFTEKNMGRAAVPSGASTGAREALELRDMDKKVYLGKGVLQAINNIHNIITPALLGKSIFDQAEIDKIMLELDGSEFKSQLGANSLLAVSLAAARAGALEAGLPLYRYLRDNLNAPNPVKAYRLPAPLMNIINGGEHASNNLDIQEFMIVPHLNESFSRNLQAGVEIFHHLKSVLHSKGHSTNVGDEGGFAPNLESHDQAVQLILSSIEKAGYRPGEDISLSFDVAASEFYNEGSYKMEGKTFTSDEVVSYFSEFTKKYPIYSIEDPLAEADFNGWAKITKELGSKVKIVGDDLFVTNKKILAEGIEKKWANSILIKVNQIGTLTETFETLSLGYKNDFDAIISHRSGETGDNFISDLAVACGAGHIKTGSASRSDRMEKYNQLLRIEEDLGESARFDIIK